MVLEEKQMEFLKTEFLMSEGDIADIGYDNMKELREKCFDIEVEEATKADNEGGEISARGEMATDIVDAILECLKSVKQVVA